MIIMIIYHLCCGSARESQSGTSTPLWAHPTVWALQKDRGVRVLLAEGCGGFVIWDGESTLSRHRGTKNSRVVGVAEVNCPEYAPDAARGVIPSICTHTLRLVLRTAGGAQEVVSCSMG